jgi:hypothetical protein
VAFGRTWGEDLAGMVIAASDVTFAQAEEWERRVAAADPDPAPVSARWVGNAAAVYRQFAEVGGRLVADFSTNPVWYFADGYLDVLPYLPRPVTYLWSERGFAATPELREHFAVAQKVIVPHSDALRSDPDLADFQADLDAADLDGSAYYLAYVISPKDTRPPEQPPETFAFIAEHIDVEAWQRYFDSFVPMLSALVSGPAESLPPCSPPRRCRCSAWAARGRFGGGKAGQGGAGAVAAAPSGCQYLLGPGGVGAALVLQLNGLHRPEQGEHGGHRYLEPVHADHVGHGQDEQKDRDDEHSDRDPPVKGPCWS